MSWLASPFPSTAGSRAATAALAAAVTLAVACSPPDVVATGPAIVATDVPESLRVGASEQFTVTATGLDPAEEYLLRVRYRGAFGCVSRPIARRFGGRASHAETFTLRACAQGTGAIMGGLRRLTDGTAQGERSLAVLAPSTVEVTGPTLTVMKAPESLEVGAGGRFTVTAADLDPTREYLMRAVFRGTLGADADCAARASSEPVSSGRATAAATFAVHGCAPGNGTLRAALSLVVDQTALRPPQAVSELLPVTVAAGDGGRARSAASAPDRRPRLASLRVSGASGEMVPAFAPETPHYRVRCDERETLSVSARARHGHAMTINGTPVGGEVANHEVRLTHNQDVIIRVRGAGAAYVVHCVPEDFPEVEIVLEEEDASDELLLTTPYYETLSGSRGAYLSVLDKNGVPRFHQRAKGAQARNFRWHPEHGVYSYQLWIGADEEVVLLDPRFMEIDRVETIGLGNTDGHDQLMTEEGHLILLSYSPTDRGDSPRLRRNGGFVDFDDNGVVEDSVIQEIARGRDEVLFEWNSWDHLNLADCISGGRGNEYAHVNSVQLVDGGDAIVASFRTCSHVLKIERPSGRVIWQLGGRGPDELEAAGFAARRDGRVYYRIVGDPVGGFCGQHTPHEIDGETVVLFDNGSCRRPATPDAALESHQSRVVEYRLSGDGARFVRHYQLPEDQSFSRAAGAVQLLDDGNWLVTWGVGTESSVTQVDPAGREIFEMKMHAPGDPDNAAFTYRAYSEAGLEPPLNLP